MNVAVIGASAKAERYSYQAVKLLQQKGHNVYPVHPSFAEIEGTPVYAKLSAINAEVDTVTLYLAAKNQLHVAEELMTVLPRRVIFNPGTENPELMRRLAEAGVETVEACTLVMLKTGSF